MKLLLDTHAFLWFVGGHRRLTRRARRAMEETGTTLYVSAASVWEMAIKASLGRLTLPLPVMDYMQEKTAAGFKILPVEWTHAAAVETMPFHHRDPFDRLLAAQALTERIPLVTGDPAFAPYGVITIW